MTSGMVCCSAHGPENKSRRGVEGGCKGASSGDTDHPTHPPGEGGREPKDPLQCLAVPSPSCRGASSPGFANGASSASLCPVCRRVRPATHNAVGPPAMPHSQRPVQDTHRSLCSHSRVARWEDEPWPLAMSILQPALPTINVLAWVGVAL